MESARPPATASVGDGVDIEFLIDFFRRTWLLVVLCAFGVGTLGYASTYLRSKIYQAEAVLIPADDNSQQSPLRALAGRYGALAGMAGMQADVGGFPVPAVLAMLESRQFLEEFIRERNLLPVLFAKRWDSAAKAWKLNKNARPPNLEDGYDVLIKRVLAVKEDRRTGLVRVTVKWTDPQLAAAWANALVEKVNETTRTLTIEDANRSLEFLHQERERAINLDLKQSISSLIESQMNRRMLATTRPQFAFRVIDRAQPSNLRKYVEPRRARTAAFALLLGAALGLVIAGLRERRRALRSRPSAAG